MLIKGKRSENNLYELQVESVNLGHKSDDGAVCGSLKKVTFEDGENVGFAEEIVGANVNFLIMTLTLNTLSNMPWLVLWRSTLRLCRVAMV